MEKLGKVLYKIRDEEGEVHKRHCNQIKIAASPAPEMPHILESKSPEVRRSERSTRAHFRHVVCKG